MPNVPHPMHPQGAVVDVEPVLDVVVVDDDSVFVGTVEGVLVLVDSAAGGTVDVVEDVGGDRSIVSCVRVVVVTGTRTAGTSSVGGYRAGRTVRYSASVTTKAPERTSVEVRGRRVIARRMS